jgi:hypothetical protein
MCRDLEAVEDVQALLVFAEDAEFLRRVRLNPVWGHNPS